MIGGLLPGQRLARGVSRHLRTLDFAALPEFVPAPGLRVDLMALGPRGEIWIVECKSSRVDFISDCKWGGYLAWCDRFFWAAATWNSFTACVAFVRFTQSASPPAI